MMIHSLFRAVGNPFPTGINRNRCDRKGFLSPPNNLIPIMAIAAIALTILLVACGSDSSPTENNNPPPPGSQENRVRIGCPRTIASPDADTVIQLAVYLTNDRDVAGFTLGFHYNSEDIEIVGASPGPALDADTNLFTGDYPEDNLFLVLWVDLSAHNPLSPDEDALAFSLALSIPAGVAPQTIDIDSSFVVPSNRFILAFADGSDVSPGFDDCGAADVIIESQPATTIRY